MILTNLSRINNRSQNFETKALLLLLLDTLKYTSQHKLFSRVCEKQTQYREKCFLECLLLIKSSQIISTFKKTKTKNSQ